MLISTQNVIILLNKVVCCCNIFLFYLFFYLQEASENPPYNKSIWCTTTVREWENFTSFISNEGPFDVIIDGLNLAYCNGHKRDKKNYVKVNNKSIYH